MLSCANLYFLQASKSNWEKSKLQWIPKAQMFLIILIKKNKEVIMPRIGTAYSRNTPQANRSSFYTDDPKDPPQNYFDGQAREVENEVRKLDDLIDEMQVDSDDENNLGYES